MVGTGIFTSLGFQVGDLPSGFAIIALWALAGFAPCAARSPTPNSAPPFPVPAANINFLREIYHPSLGFLAGWISATVGFSAPVAIAAMPFGTYLAGDISWDRIHCLGALGVVWITTSVLLFDLRLGSAFQIGSTILKVALDRRDHRARDFTFRGRSRFRFCR